MLGETTSIFIYLIVVYLSVFLFIRISYIYCVSYFYGRNSLEPGKINYYSFGWPLVTILGVVYALIRLIDMSTWPLNNYISELGETRYRLHNERRLRISNSNLFEGYRNTKRKGKPRRGG